MSARKLGPVDGICINGHRGELNRWTADGKREWISCSHKDANGYCNAEQAPDEPPSPSLAAAVGPPPPPTSPHSLGTDSRSGEVVAAIPQVASALREVAEAVALGLGNVADAIRTYGSPPPRGPETALRSTRTGDQPGGDVMAHAGGPDTPGGPPPAERVGQILENLRGTA